jgi:hypothetical protein
VPPPEPDPPETTVSQDAVVVTVHEHPAAAATSKVAVPPVASMVRLGGVTPYAHATPCCVTDTVCPATVSDPVRDEAPVCAATVKVNAPDPVIDVPPVAVIHDAPEAAVHAHEFPVVTLTAPAPPAALMVIDVVERVNVQVGCAGLESQLTRAATPASRRKPAVMRAPRADVRKCMDRPSPIGTVCAPVRVGCQVPRNGARNGAWHHSHR